MQTANADESAIRKGLEEALDELRGKYEQALDQPSGAGSECVVLAGAQDSCTEHGSGKSSGQHYGPCEAGHAVGNGHMDHWKDRGWECNQQGTRQGFVPASDVSSRNDAH